MEPFARLHSKSRLLALPSNIRQGWMWQAVINAQSCSSAVLQCCSATVVQCYSATVVQWYSGTVLQCYSATVLQWYSATVLQCYSATVLRVFCCLCQSANTLCRINYGRKNMYSTRPAFKWRDKRKIYDWDGETREKFIIKERNLGSLVVENVASVWMTLSSNIWWWCRIYKTFYGRNYVAIGVTQSKS
jgi:hypothetical protein